MPILPAAKGTQVRNYFVTIGPQNPSFSVSDREDHVNGYRDVLQKVYGNVIDTVNVSFETGNNGYHHMHMVIKLRTERRWAQCCAALRKYHDSTEKYRFEERKTSVWFGFMPASSGINDAMMKYLTTPSKEKTVGDVQELEFEQYDPFAPTLLGSANQLLWECVSKDYCDSSLDSGRLWFEFINGRGPEPRLKKCSLEMTKPEPPRPRQGWS